MRHDLSSVLQAYDALRQNVCLRAVSGFCDRPSPNLQAPIAGAPSMMRFILGMFRRRPSTWKTRPMLILRDLLMHLGEVRMLIWNARWGGMSVPVWQTSALASPERGHFYGTALAPGRLGD